MVAYRSPKVGTSRAPTRTGAWMCPVQCRGLLGGVTAHLKAATVPPFDAAISSCWSRRFFWLRHSPRETGHLPFADSPLASREPRAPGFPLHPPLPPPVWLLDPLTSLQQAPQQAHQKSGKRSLEDSLCQTTLCHQVYLFLCDFTQNERQPLLGPKQVQSRGSYPQTSSQFIQHTCSSVVQNPKRAFLKAKISQLCSLASLNPIPSHTEGTCFV